MFGIDFAENCDMGDLIGKLSFLSPQRLAEVEDFVDFLRQRESDQQLRQAFAQASATTLNTIWDNDEDAVYDSL